MADPMLEKVDILRKRFQISYREAYDVLERNDRNVVRACIELEGHACDTGLAGKMEERIQVMGSDLVGKIQEIVQTGQASSIRVMRDGRTVMAIPTAVGVVGALIFPYLAVLGTAAAVAARYEVVIDKRVGQPSGVGHRPSVVNVHHETAEPQADEQNVGVTPSVSSGKMGNLNRVQV
ncbi:DUF4342 domain-containing protein [Tumebacillus lipolyticus]|uniref:DUF4342 domain-containing protein n=1 Tax=Tumebacillus lipolyticus TaxID=1280370 RepID=A0ABW4ZYK3_9BACL